MRYKDILCETIAYSDYGYWITARGEPLVVPDSSHYKVLLRHYAGAARFFDGRYGEVLADGWIWVTVSGMLLCFLDPTRVGKSALSTLIRIVNDYADFSDYRLVTTRQGGHVGSEKHDFTDARATIVFLRQLISDTRAPH